MYQVKEMIIFYSDTLPNGQIILNGLDKICLTNNFQYLALMILRGSGQTSPNLSKKQMMKMEISDHLPL